MTTETPENPAAPVPEPTPPQPDGDRGGRPSKGTKKDGRLTSTKKTQHKKK